MPIDYEAEGLLYPDRRVEQTGRWTRVDGAIDDPGSDYNMIDIWAIRTANGAEFPLSPTTMTVDVNVVDILDASEADIASLLENALDAACLAIQQRIGQTDGGTAGIYFSGSTRAEFDAMFRAYIDSERAFRARAAN